MHEGIRENDREHTIEHQPNKYNSIFGANVEHTNNSPKHNLEEEYIPGANYSQRKIKENLHLKN